MLFQGHQPGGLLLLLLFCSPIGHGGIIFCIRVFRAISHSRICYQVCNGTVKNDTCAWTPNKVFMRLGSLDTWAWVPRLGGESALVNRCFARSTC